MLIVIFKSLPLVVLLLLEPLPPKISPPPNISPKDPPPPNTLLKISNGEFPISYFIISKSLRGYYKNPKSIAHKVLADRKRC